MKKVLYAILISSILLFSQASGISQGVEVKASGKSSPLLTFPKKMPVGRFTSYSTLATGDRDAVRREMSRWYDSAAPYYKTTLNLHFDNQRRTVGELLEDLPVATREEVRHQIPKEWLGVSIQLGDSKRVASILSNLPEESRLRFSGDLSASERLLNAAQSSGRPDASASAFIATISNVLTLDTLQAVVSQGQKPQCMVIVVLRDSNDKDVSGYQIEYCTQSDGEYRPLDPRRDSPVAFGEVPAGATIYIRISKTISGAVMPFFIRYKPMPENIYQQTYCYRSYRLTDLRF